MHVEALAVVTACRYIKILEIKTVKKRKEKRKISNINHLPRLLALRAGGGGDEYGPVMENTTLTQTDVTD
jgi:hypothetical protein